MSRINCRPCIIKERISVSNQFWGICPESNSMREKKQKNKLIRIRCYPGWALEQKEHKNKNYKILINYQL